MLTTRQIEFLIRNCTIKLAWLIYVICLQKHGGDESHGWHFDPWQHEDIFFIFDEKIVCINRCRSGSKTRDMSALCVFFRLRGLIPVWMSSNRKQIMRAQVYWNENFFVQAAPIALNREMIHLKNGTQFSIFVLKKGLNNDRGPRAHCIFYDEMSKMDKDLVENTRSFSGGMDYDGSHIYWIHFSTPEINTSFHECSMQYPTSTHDCFCPSWFSAAYIESVRIDLSEQKFKQEMLALFVSMAGALLDGHIVTGICPYRLTDYTYFGMDPNAREGYCVVGVRYTHDFKFAQYFFCKNFGPAATGKRLALEFLHTANHSGLCKGIEIETNGVGMPVYDDFVDEGGEAIASFWTQIDKIRRVNNMTKCTYYINTTESRDLSALYSQLMSLSLTERGDAIDKPADKPWHFADSAIHSSQGNASIIWA